MRILHVIPFLWSGAGNVVTRLCLSQSKHNRVAIVTSGQSKGFIDWPEYRERLHQAGIGHFEIDFFDRSPEVFWPSTERFAKLAQRWKPDLIHCHSGVPAAAAAVSGSRFIAQIHSWGLNRPEWMNAMDLRGFRQADRVVCSSKAYRRILIAGGICPARVHCIPWGLDLAEIHARSCNASSDPGAFRIGFLGRIEPRKNQLALAEAFHRFYARYPKSTLQFIGPVADKKYASEVRGFIDKAGLAGTATLLGRVANPYPKVKRWNLFTSLSSDEGQGMAVLEAMALGVPVLGRSVAGIEDYLHDRRTGITLHSASLHEAVAGMEWAFHHRKELISITAQARQMVEKDYNWDSTIGKMRNLYATITSSNQ
jgi:glycosyltransferase involved in cell wall biosynthesis